MTGVCYIGTALRIMNKKVHLANIKIKADYRTSHKYSKLTMSLELPPKISLHGQIFLHSYLGS